MNRQVDCVVTGSFDPFTSGHFHLVEKALEYFDHAYILIADNPNKKYMFAVHERQAIIEDAFDRPMYKGKIIVCQWHRQTVDWCEASGVYTIVRGIRDANDMAYELNMAHVNRMLGRDKHGINVDTIFIPSYYDDTNISSSLVRMSINSHDYVWSNYVVNPKFITDIISNHCNEDIKKQCREMVKA